MARHEIVVEEARWTRRTITPVPQTDGPTVLDTTCETGERVPATGRTIECSCGAAFESIDAAHEHLYVQTDASGGGAGGGGAGVGAGADDGGEGGDGAGAGTGDGDEADR